MPVSTDSGAAASVAAPGGAAPRSQPWIAIATLILGLALGVAAGLVIPRFSHPGTDSVEAGFLRDMSTHHAQAVEMSMTAHANSSNPRIVTLAGDIALTQHGQIGYMQAWLRDWDLSPTGTEAPMAWMPNSAGSVVNGLMPGMATPEQLDSLRKATGNALDIQFLTLMRAHHLGGIHMAQEAIDLSDDENIDWLAQTMVAGQQGELALIDSLLKDLQPA
ncbi:DUF305 domain-containing protein [Paractinoplanes hotanensis]|uniref:DUF305 domain-containing protein n=1 Tax=Paractinoplanes hotanensis TaxID=2906497 RepID=A0ABT0XT92_9ACTN|nr:DUF305 domain-containing protein [Actinoplanes hotanensis]MCM4076850.1 DUF305 domain-containing protein [Actinoplanes hotanensis]